MIFLIISYYSDYHTLGDNIMVYTSKTIAMTVVASAGQEYLVLASEGIAMTIMLTANCHHMIIACGHGLANIASSI